MAKTVEMIERSSAANQKNQYEGGRARFQAQVGPDGPESIFSIEADEDGNFRTNISDMVKKLDCSSSSKSYYRIQDQPEQDDTILETDGPYATSKEDVEEKYGVVLPEDSKLVVDGASHVVYFDPSTSRLVRGNWFTAINEEESFEQEETQLRTGRNISLSLLKSTDIGENMIFLGYTDGTVEIRSSLDINTILYQRGGQQEGAVEKIEYFSVISQAVQVIYLAILFKQGDEYTTKIYLLQPGADRQWQVLKESALERVHSSMLTKAGGKLLYQSKVNEVTCIQVEETCKQRQVFSANHSDQWGVDMPVIKVLFCRDKVIAIGLKSIRELSSAGQFESAYPNSHRLRFNDGLSLPNNTLIVATDCAGIVLYDLNDEVDASERQYVVFPDQQYRPAVYKLSLSPCKRFIVAAGEHQLLTLEFCERQTSCLGFIGNQAGTFCKGAQDVQVSSEFVFARQNGENQGWTVLNMLTSNISTTARSRQLMGKLSAKDSIIITNDDPDNIIVIEAVIGSDGQNDYGVDRLKGSQFTLLSAQDKAHGFRIVPGCFYFQETWFAWVIYAANTTLTQVRWLDVCEGEREFLFLEFTQRFDPSKLVAVPTLEESEVLNLFLYDMATYVEVNFTTRQHAKLQSMSEEDQGQVPPKTVIYKNASFYIAKRQGKIQGGDISSTDGMSHLNEGIELNAEDLKYNPLKDECFLHQYDGKCYVTNGIEEQMEFRKLPYATDLDSTLFLGHNLIAARMKGFTGCYGIYRVSDGTKLCHFDDNDFKFVRQTTCPEFIDPVVYRILDLCTNKIYPATVKTLIHLGAYKVNLNQTDLLQEQDAQQDEIGQLQVLCLPGPSLFPKCFYAFTQSSITQKRVMASNSSLEYVFLMRMSPTVHIAENMFQYLTREDLDVSLKNWLIQGESNYLACAGGNSVLKNLQVGCADIVLDYFQGLIDMENYSIFINITMEEIQAAFRKLPQSQTCRLLDMMLIESFSDFDSVGAVNQDCINKLGDCWKGRIDPNAKAFDTSDHFVVLKPAQTYRKCFSPAAINDQKPVQFQKLLLKLDIIPGSEGSINLLMAFQNQPGDPNNDRLIYTSKVVGAILQFKMQTTEVRVFSHLQMYVYIAFLVCIHFDPRKYTILTWTIIHSCIEIFQMFGKGSTWTDFSEYFFDLWNFIDWARLTCQIAYVTALFQCRAVEYGVSVHQLEQCDKATYAREIKYGSSCYGLLIFFAWLGLLEHLRYFKSFRTLVVFFEKLLKAMPFFLSGLVIVLVGIISAVYWKGALQNHTEHEFPAKLSEQIDWVFSFDWSSSDQNAYDHWQYLVWGWGFLALLLILFGNLGIAVVGKAHDDTMVENGMMLARHNRELAEYLLDQEVMIVWRRCLCLRQKPPQHLFFSEYQPEAGFDRNQGIQQSMVTLQTQIGALSAALAASNTRNQQMVDELRAKQARDMGELRSQIVRSEENTTKSIKALENRTMKSLRTAKTDSVEISTKLDLIIDKIEGH